jgi:4-aminobutyrate aminotransferase-like enzyme
MLMAHPAVLHNLVEQYETLLALHAEDGSAEARQRLEDVSYTLCVSTGTRSIDAALQAARAQLAGVDAGGPAVAA